MHPSIRPLSALSHEQSIQLRKRAHHSSERSVRGISSRRSAAAQRERRARARASERVPLGESALALVASRYTGIFAFSNEGGHISILFVHGDCARKPRGKARVERGRWCQARLDREIGEIGRQAKKSARAARDWGGSALLGGHEREEGRTAGRLCGKRAARGLATSRARARDREGEREARELRQRAARPARLQVSLALSLSFFTQRQRQRRRKAHHCQRAPLRLSRPGRHRRAQTAGRRPHAHAAPLWQQRHRASSRAIRPCED